MEERHYKFTVHLRERFLQRTNKRYEHIDSCKSKDCPNCKKLIDEIKREAWYRSKTINIEIARRLRLATEEKSFLNNSQFMSTYYEKYGYDHNFSLRLHEDLLFVVVSQNGKNTVVTCVCAKNHFTAGVTQRPKFRKKSLQGDGVVV
jgi:predicted glycoside hydrolase/deacetylase ChbG (UPF0249 family)